MNRKEFFKKLGLGVLGIAVAPKVLAEIKEERSHVISVSRTVTNYGATSEIFYDGNYQCSTFAPWEYESDGWWIPDGDASSKIAIKRK